MLSNRVIEEADSPYFHNVIIVGKKDGAAKGIDRLCVNYVPFNRKTYLDQYPLPHIREMLTLFSGCWQIKLRKED